MASECAGEAGRASHSPLRVARDVVVERRVDLDVRNVPVLERLRVDLRVAAVPVPEVVAGPAVPPAAHGRYRRVAALVVAVLGVDAQAEAARAQLRAEPLHAVREAHGVGHDAARRVVAARVGAEGAAAARGVEELPAAVEVHVLPADLVEAVRDDRVGDAHDGRLVHPVAALHPGPCRPPEPRQADAVVERGRGGRQPARRSGRTEGEHCGGWPDI
jgi:hypothetical protein